MMAKAGRVHSLHLGLVAVVIAALAVGSREITCRFQAASLVEQLVAADVAQVPRIVDRLAGYRRWADPLLRKEQDKSRPDSRPGCTRLWPCCRSMPRRPTTCASRFWWSTPPQFAIVVRDALQPAREELVARALGAWRWTRSGRHEARFQAACAWPRMPPPIGRWSQVSALVAGHLVALPASEFLAWRETLRPARRTTASMPWPQSITTRPGASKAACMPPRRWPIMRRSDPAVLFDLLATAELYQFPMIFEKLAAHAEPAAALARAELAKNLPAAAGEEEKEALAQRQALPL